MFGDPPTPPTEEAETPRDPLLLLADPVAGPSMWDALVPILVGGFVVVREPVVLATPDGPPTSAAGAAEWAEQELLARNIYPVHVVASGFAASAAIRLARMRPELLRSLVLHAPIVRFGASFGGGAPGRNEIARRFEGVAAALERGDAIGARHAWRAVLQPAARRPAPAMGVALGIDSAQARWLGEWRDPEGWTVGLPEDFEFLSPVLVVEAADAPPFLQRIGEELAGRFPNATRLRLPSADAFLPEADPQRLAAVLFNFCLERNVPVA